MRNVLAVVCFLLTGLVSSHVVSAEPVNPADVEAFFDDTVTALMDGTGIPGVTLSVVQNGEVIILKGYGVADIKTGEPVDPETTVFRIGSITKPFTAIAALQQVDAGTLDLNTDINQYLYPYRVPDTYPDPVTAHHILTHQSGFDVDISYLYGPRFKSEKISTEEIERRLIRIRRPGEVAAYDNLGFGILGLVIDFASGGSYDQAIAKGIFRPLGMNRSFVDLPPNRTGNLAGCHLWSSPEKVWSCEHDSFSDLAKSAGAIASTASDMAKFMLWLLDDNKLEGDSILSPESFADLTNFDNYRVHPMSPGIGRSLVEYNVSGRRAFGHNGGLDGFMSDMSLFPESDIGYFISVAGTPGMMAPLKLSALLTQAQGAPSAEAIEVFQEKYGGLKKAFAEEFVPRSVDWPPVLSSTESEKLGSINIQDRVPGLYRSLRNTSKTLLVKLAGGAQSTAITMPSSKTLVSSISGAYQEAAPLYFEHEDKDKDKDKETGLTIVSTDENTYVFASTLPIGGVKRHPQYTSPTFTLLPIPIALLILLSSIVYALPRFAGERRRIALFGLLGTALASLAVVLELEYATWFLLVEGNAVLPMLWRLLLIVGLVIFLMVSFRIVQLWRRQEYGTGWRGIVQKGHGALIAASCLTVVCLSVYWAAA